ncbi:uncharacterized protein TrAtP1_002478 [Trichoderma atroviride]|uniref:uncharacterized protein n=1 Tax=Hypocrea atroviridis TaxID=63577 RepID=UPI00331A128E|nr:hypothetical protein TrAtP1_002478 [Trichoderma atroviride]
MLRYIRSLPVLASGGEGATGNRARESMRAPHRQRSLFAASLSIVNQSSAPPEDRLHHLDTWITELRPSSEMMGPEEAPTRPASPQIESNIDQPSAIGHLVFGFEDLETLEASLGSGQCQSKSFTGKEGGSSANDRVVSEFSVNVDGLLWVNGYESCKQDDLGGQPGRQMTLVVLKFTLSSRGLHERFDSMRISLQFEAFDSEHWKQPTVEAWAPFGPMDRMGRPETRQKQTNEINEDAALIHSTAGLSMAARTEGELVRPGFDQVHSTVEVHHQTGRPYGVTWVLEENNIREADTSLEFNTAVLVSRSSSDPYNAKFDLNAFVGPSREQFNEVRQFTIQQGQPWVSSEGEEMMKNIDLRNLGNLRNREITIMLDIPLGSGYVECHHPRD